MSSKQAELRRLMKIQREKKEQEQQEVVQQQQQPRSILRRNKQDDNNSPPNSKQNSNALSSLLTAYSDDYGENSSQEDEKDTKKKVMFAGESADNAKGVSWDKAQLETTHEIPRREENQRPTVDQRTQHHVQADDWLGMLRAVETDGPVQQQESTTGESTGDFDEQWKEFEALVGDNDNNSGQSEATNSAAEADLQTPSNEKDKVASSAALAAEPPQPAGDEAQPDEQDEKRPSTTEVEQTSYEARIAKLRLKALQRRKKAPESKDLTLSSLQTYTPELAVAQEEADSEATDATKRAADQETLTSLEILRQKRARVRKELLADEDDED